MMDKNNQRIREILQGKDVASLVQENLRHTQVDIKVTIGRAAELFQIKQNKLRELDKLLFPERPKDTTEQRQYSLTELNKLAIINVLLNRGISANDIPANIDEIWAEVASDSSVSSSPFEQNNSHKSSDEGDVPISVDKRVESANQEAFWRYFISQAMMLALNLIFEDIPDPVVGIMLPLQREAHATSTWESKHVNQLGECLIGWRDKNRSYTTFYTPAPKFDFHTDFRISGLQAKDESEPQDRTFVVLQRNTITLNLSQPVVETIRRVLAPIYEDVPIWKPYFTGDMKDVFYPTIPSVGTTIPSALLTSIAEMAIRLGGKTADGNGRWKFCAILVPDDLSLSMHQRSLVVQAQSSRSPHVVGKTKVSPDTPILSLSLRAFQSIHALYRTPVSSKDETIAYRDIEGPIQSAIAIPIKGRGDLPVALLYLVSDEARAFGTEYQRVLRLLALTIGELLDSPRALRHNAERLSDIIARPQVVNTTLGAFLSENDFVKDVEGILRNVLEDDSPSMDGTTSFISIDVDNLSHLTNKYGNQVLVNLSKALGNRIEEQIGLLFDKQKGCKIYHIYADRFYLLLNGISLEKTRENAENLRKALGGNYPIIILPKVSQTPIAQQGSIVELEGITVRLDVSSYKHTKFLKILKDYPQNTCVEDVLAGSVIYFLDVGLNMGRQEGGNCIISYYPPEPPFDHSRFALWRPQNNNSEV